MKEMEYKTREEREVLASGIYKGILYYILSLGYHPCAYIRIPEEIILDNEEIEDIDVHGGITFHENSLKIRRRRNKRSRRKFYRLGLCSL